MESTTLEREPSSETESKPPQKRTIADQLRKLAAWIDEHEVTDDDLMTAEVGKYCRPRIIFYRRAALATCFPGRKCVKKEHQSSDVYSLTDDGIDFVAWESAGDKPAQETEVTL